MFACLHNGVYAIISHSNITITIFLHSSYTHILRIINVTMIYLHPGRLWCQPLVFTCLHNGLYAIISHSDITITIFLHSSYTQILRIINLTMLYLHPHKQGRLWCQPLMFACLQNGLYEIISHSNITITIFLHSSYTQIPRIINFTMIYLHQQKWGRL